MYLTLAAEALRLLVIENSSGQRTRATVALHNNSVMYLTLAAEALRLLVIENSSGQRTRATVALHNNSGGGPDEIRGYSQDETRVDSRTMGWIHTQE
ncbi:hypothetical protein NDU88_004081 [Pleurodeles waltl]|uniref:Uncharacterized protein n=1 Tax=Pleurodeles waltl TaxID=8319 RepID=A0AAV7RH25_PLEWA|nr:hypothetical protein NDU88_004081 [Pleurodeles waltl]